MVVVVVVVDMFAAFEKRREGRKAEMMLVMVGLKDTKGPNRVAKSRKIVELGEVVPGSVRKKIYTYRLLWSQSDAE